MSRRNDVAIYSPFAFRYYEDPTGERYQNAAGGGGAELQTTLLARMLPRLGLRAAHIVYPVSALRDLPEPAPEVVQRPAKADRGSIRARIGELFGVWRSLGRADAELYVFRTGLSGGIAAFLVGALFATLRRRRLVLAASNDLDFIYGRPDRARLSELLYRLALRKTSVVVVQSRQQLELARAALPDGHEVALIPSFAQPADGDRNPRGGAAADPGFLWIGRIVEYKLPLEFVRLARELPGDRFVMVGTATGETPAGLAQEVNRAAAGLANLELVSRMHRERLMPLIADSLAVVNTSHHEGMPNVFLEAWARGVPVVSLNFDPDGKLEGERIGIYAAGSRERFVDGIRELAANPKLRSDLGANGRRYVERTHSPDAVSQRWAELLEAALEG